MQELVADVADDSHERLCLKPIHLYTGNIVAELLPLVPIYPNLRFPLSFQVFCNSAIKAAERDHEMQVWALMQTRRELREQVEFLFHKIDLWTKL